MSPKLIIENALSATLSDEGGEQIRIELMSGLSPEEIDEFASSLPCPLPVEICNLLAYCRGFTGAAADVVDFTGHSCLFEAVGIFPYGLPIAADGFGNFWVVDLTPDADQFGPVYYAGHDAPIVLFQSRTLEDFLVELFKVNMPPYESLVDDVHEDRLFEVWRKNPGAVLASTARVSGDKTIRSFADTLDERWSIIDLRDVSPGMGFSWGRYGPKTEIRRAGYAPVFAYKKPRGFLSRLFGK